MHNKAKIQIVEPVLYVLLLSQEEVIDDSDLVPPHHQLVDEVTSNESRSPVTMIFLVSCCPRAKIVTINAWYHQQLDFPLEN